MVGYYDNPLLGTLSCKGADISDGTTYVIAAGNMPYGVSHTYLASKLGPMQYSSDQTGNGGTLMRYD